MLATLQDDDHVCVMLLHDVHVQELQNKIRKILVFRLKIKIYREIINKYYKAVPSETSLT